MHGITVELCRRFARLLTVSTSLPLHSQSISTSTMASRPSPAAADVPLKEFFLVLNKQTLAISHSGSFAVSYHGTPETSGSVYTCLAD